MIDRHDIPQNLPDWARPDGPGLDSALPATGTETVPTGSGSGSETTVPGSEPVADAAPVSRAAPEPVTDLEERKEEMLEALKDVVDPELMVNIVDLGLVYGVDIDDENNVTIDMTLTSPACPLTDQIEMGVHDALQGLADSVTVNWVWLPAWSLECITPDGREQLRYIGYNL